MGAVIAEGMCCCFMCCCKDISDALKRFLGPQRVTKIFYLFLVVVFTVPAIVVFFYLNKWQLFTNYFSWMQCPQASGGYEGDYEAG
jgi:energy-converting hydrogenase Eha subunit F